MIRAVIFDCFGVVISDSLSVMCSERLGDNPAAVREVWGLIERANKGVITPDESSARIGELFGLNIAEYRQQLSLGELKDEKLLAYVKELRKSYKTAMLSNVGIGSLGRRFAEGELQQYFDVVVASAEIGWAKPEPEAYEITAERLGVRTDECVIADDREAYCEGAQSVGMKAVLYKDFSQFRAELEPLLADT